MIETKDLLNWYFTVGALVFGVFGFLYSVYASAMFQATPEKPMPAPITVFLKLYLRVVVAVLTVLTVTSAVTGFRASAGWETWVLILCFVVLTGFSIRLAWRLS
jgi:hypothetical protein